MELSGHPSEDLIAELIDRGAAAVPGDAAGPDPGAVEVLPARLGSWLWIPETVFETGVDDSP